MPTLHLTAFIYVPTTYPPAPVPARSEPGHAPAFKPTREAGRRGGESTARWNCYLFVDFSCKTSSILKKAISITYGNHSCFLRSHLVFSETFSQMMAKI